jgi:hypothetical protein
MLILIFELSKFLIITFYLCENLSLNTREVSFQVIHQFQRASFIREDLPDLHTFPIKSFLDGGLLPLKELRSSSVHRSSFCMQPNREWSQSIFLVLDLLSWFYS